MLSEEMTRALFVVGDTFFYCLRPIDMQTMQLKRSTCWFNLIFYCHID